MITGSIDRLRRSRKWWGATQSRLFADALIAERLLTVEEFKQMQVEIEHFIDTTYEEAAAEPAPDPNGVLEHLYGPPVDALRFRSDRVGEPATMVEAINQALHAGMEEVPAYGDFRAGHRGPEGRRFRSHEGP